MQSTRTRSVEDCHVLIVDDQISSRLILESLLDDMVTCTLVSTAHEAIEWSRANKPDLILMDVVMPDMDGHHACKILSENVETANIPVIFVTASATDIEQEKCREAGGVDFVEKPVNPTTLRNRVKSHLNHKLKTDLLEKLIYLDRLTGAYNRHYLEEVIPSVIRDAERNQRDLSFVLFDIDHFKQFNDLYGHLEGDSCLWTICKETMQSLLRPLDVLVRVGGEEFLAILPETDEKGAFSVANRLIATIESLGLKHEHSPTNVVTVSAGVSSYQQADDGMSEHGILRADKALYEAKARGRNNAVLYNANME
ncbi:diguanylate cyclase [Alteromonas sp. H39]|uniref:GGDEF domain-containing response regulator n=1 Tax=Alteromonas sp. H39 TaxID=3389876 RepID=UPI0039E02E17